MATYEGFVNDKLGNEFPIMIDLALNENEFDVWIELKPFELQCHTTIDFENLVFAYPEYTENELRDMFEYNLDFQHSIFIELRELAEDWFNHREEFSINYTVDRC